MWKEEDRSKYPSAKHYYQKEIDRLEKELKKAKGTIDLLLKKALKK